MWIGALGIHYKLGLDGLNVVAGRAHLACCSAPRSCGRPSASGSARGSFYFHFGLAQSAVLGAFCAQDLALFVAFFDLMLIPFYFLIGMWGDGPSACARRPSSSSTRSSARSSCWSPRSPPACSPPRARHAAHLRALGAPAPAALARLAGLDLPVLRARVPGQDAAGPVPRLAGRRLQGDADPRRRGLLRRPLQGRRLRVPADRAAAVPVRRGPLPVARAGDRAGLDHLGAPLLAFTTPDARLVVAYSSVAQLGSSRSGSSRCSPRAARARCCRCSTTAS